MTQKNRANCQRGINVNLKISVVMYYNYAEHVAFYNLSSFKIILLTNNLICKNLHAFTW